MGKKKTAEAEQREGVPHVSSLSMVQKHIV